MCYLATINYESGNFWAAIAALAISVASLVAAIVSLVLARNALVQAQQVADRDLRNWTQQKWFDLYEAAEKFCLLLEQFQAKYNQRLTTKEFVDDMNALTFAGRRTLPFASVFPQNTTIDAFFDCINKWPLVENVFSKEMLKDYADAIEGFRLQARVAGEVVITSKAPEFSSSET
jgi:endonuclease/exonuclease/phosphatase (EEP) superfamily protein YafD